MEYIEQALGIFYIVVTAYMFILSAIVHAPGLYMWMFKIMPIFIGLASAFYALQYYGFVIQLN